MKLKLRINMIVARLFHDTFNESNLFFKFKMIKGFSSNLLFNFLSPPSLQHSKRTKLALSYKHTERTTDRNRTKSCRGSELNDFPFLEATVPVFSKAKLAKQMHQQAFLGWWDQWVCNWNISTLELLFFTHKTLLSVQGFHYDRESYFRNDTNFHIFLLL